MIVFYAINEHKKIPHLYEVPTIYSKTNYCVEEYNSGVIMLELNLEKKRVKFLC